MSTTGFITRYWKNSTPENTPWVKVWLWARARVLLACAVVLFGPCALVGVAHAESGYLDIQSVALERTDDGLFLTSQLVIELPTIVTDALGKGIPIHFVASAELRRDRWYWTDKRVSSSARYIRLSYQPLSRRWRVQQGNSPSLADSSALAQHFDTLADALAVVRRISRWRIASASDIEGGVLHYVDYQFRLDVSQLPRPIQIGALGQNDWNLAVQRNLRVPEAAR